MDTVFDRDTAVRLLDAPSGGNGRQPTVAFEANIAPGWRAGRGPHGGYLAAMLLRALTAAVDDPTRSPRSLTVHYASSPEPGPARIEVSIERQGRSLSTLSARLTQEGAMMALAWRPSRFPGRPPKPTRCRCPRWRHPISELRDTPRLFKGAPEFTEQLVMQARVGAMPFVGADHPMEIGGWIALPQARAARPALARAVRRRLVPALVHRPLRARRSAPPSISRSTSASPRRARRARSMGYASRSSTPVCCTKASSRRTASSGRPTAPCCCSRASSASSCPRTIPCSCFPKILSTR